MEDRTLSFEVASVWRRNMLIRDRETGSIWQQGTGECVAGPYKGRSLEVLGGELCTWAAWRAENPDSIVALEPERWTGIIPRSVIMKMLERATRNPMTPGLTRTDRRLLQNADVAGVVVRGEARAYPIAALRGRERVSDRLGGEAITVAYDPAADRARAWRGDSPVPASRDALLPISRQFWAGWYEFHPGTDVFSDERRA